MTKFVKDPDAVLDYVVDWSDFLDDDTITGAPVWTMPAGLTKDSQSNTGTTATAFISGGTAGNGYTVACKITTAAGRTDERSFVIVVRQK